MVDFNSIHDEYALEEETRYQRSSALTRDRMVATAKRELTGQERCSTRSRFRRKKSKTSFSGTHRRRGRRSLA